MQLTRVPRPQLPLLITDFAAPAGPESEVNTPAATIGAPNSTLLVPRPHLSHLQRPGADDSFFWQHGGMRSPAITQHPAWISVPDDNLDDGLYAADNLFAPNELLYMPDSLRRGSLPEMMPPAVPVASPGAMRHALPLRLFGDVAPEQATVAYR